MTDSHAQRVQAYLDARAELTERGANLGDQIAEAKNGGRPWARLTVADVQGVLDELDAAQASLDVAWGREHELLAEIGQLKADLETQTYRAVTAEQRADGVEAELKRATRDASELEQIVADAAPAACGVDLDDGSVAYYATGE